MPLWNVSVVGWGGGGEGGLYPYSLPIIIKDIILVNGDFDLWLIYGFWLASFSFLGGTGAGRGRGVCLASTSCFCHTDFCITRDGESGPFICFDYVKGNGGQNHLATKHSS